LFAVISVMLSYWRSKNCWNRIYSFK